MKKMIDIKDYSDITGELNGYSDVNIPSFGQKSPEINLGIYNSLKWGKRSDKYCGYSWLKGKNNCQIKENGEGILLHIKPRFQLDMNIMLQTIASDDEFFDYLGLDTCDPMIRFFHDDPLIENVSVEDNLNQLISVISFISLLDRTTRVSVIKRMVKVEENDIGRIRGRILMNKHISSNILRGHNERICAEHNERTEDNLENRMLLYVLKKAEEYLKLSGDIIPSVTRMISVIRNRLSRVEVDQNEIFRCDDIDHMIFKLPNIYRNYVPVFEYAKLILIEASVNAGDGSGARVIPYAINSHMLFECYVRARIKKVIEGYNKGTNKDTNKPFKVEMLKFVRDKENIPNDDCYGANDVIRNGECYISGKVVPDIVLKYTFLNDEKIYYRVYDVKYKDSTKRYRGRDDRLQLLAYNLIYHPVNNNTGLIMPGEHFLSYYMNTEDKVLFATVIGVESTKFEDAFLP